MKNLQVCGIVKHKLTLTRWWANLLFSQLHPLVQNLLLILKLHPAGAIIYCHFTAVSIVLSFVLSNKLVNQFNCWVSVKCYPSSKILINVVQVVRIFHVEITPLFEWNSLFLWTAWTRPDVFANAACQSSAFWWPENITGDPQNDFENIHIGNHREDRPFQASSERVRSVLRAIYALFFGINRTFGLFFLSALYLFLFLTQYSCLYHLHFNVIIFFCSLFSNI